MYNDAVLVLHCPEYNSKSEYTAKDLKNLILTENKNIKMKIEGNLNPV